MTTAKMIQLALAEARRQCAGLDYSDAEIAEQAADIITEWQTEDARDREQFGSQEDSPCIANCDDAGTGEGRFHGRI